MFEFKFDGGGGLWRAWGTVLGVMLNTPAFKRYNIYFLNAKTKN